MRATQQKTVVIVGAGIAGLSAAEKLAESGVRVTVLDKARGVGGRMATRRVGGALLDHGAQYFTARDPRFTARALGWLESGLVQTWEVSPGDRIYVGTPGMTSVPKAIGAPLDVRLQERVLAIESRGGHWRVRTEPGTILRADAVVLTAPAAQSLALLAAGNVALPEAEREILEGIEYDPCFAAMAVLDGPGKLPASGWVALDGDPLAVIADNRRKRKTPGPAAVTVHAGHEFSRVHLDRDKEEVGRMLLDSAAHWLGTGFTAVSFQRWLYSRPTGRRASPCLTIPGGPPLVVAGDAFGGPRVEGAWLSGLSAAESLIPSESEAVLDQKGKER